MGARPTLSKVMGQGGILHQAVEIYYDLMMTVDDYVKIDENEGNLRRLMKV